MSIRPLHYATDREAADRLAEQERLNIRQLRAAFFQYTGLTSVNHGEAFKAFKLGVEFGRKTKDTK